MRRLIINADDLGLTAGVNRGIAEAHCRGLVTDATLMANARAFDHGVAAAKVEQLSVGCHVVLVDGDPLLPGAVIPTLVNPEGKFRDRLMGFAGAALLRRIAADEVTAEATAQIKKIQQAGLTVSHLDTHKHAHMFPAVLRPLLQAAQGCGVRAIRNPFSPARPLPARALARRPRLWKRFAEIKLLRRLSRKFRAEVEAHGMATTDGTWGILSTGALDLELFRAIVECIPDGTWEFVCHPGYNDVDLGAVRTRLRASRRQELDVLTSTEARRVIEDHGIQLITYRDLVDRSADARLERAGSN